MKILLVGINAKFIHTNLAIYNLKAFAKEYSSYIEIKEYTINHYTEDILTDIYKQKPDVIGFSCYIWNINMIEELSVELNKILPEAKIWLGGPEVSFDYLEKLKEWDFIDKIIIGEGEETFKELVECSLNNKPVSKVKGIAYRNEGLEIIINEPRNPMNMDEIIFPYDNIEEFKSQILYYETSRGCPFNCSYCLSSVDKSVRYRSLLLVKKEIKFFLDNKVSQVKLVDRTFNCNRERTYEIWKYIHDNDNGITNFHFEVSADLLNERELNLISNFRKGLIQLEIGVQSTNELTIEAINRTTDFNKLAYSVNKINQYNNIHQHLDLIAGLPYEDYQSFRNSFNQVYGLKPEQLQLGFLKVLKGADMYNCSKEYGIVFKSKAPYEVLYTNWLSYDEVIKLKSVESMVETYYNSGQFTNAIEYLLNFFESPFNFYEELSDFYENNHYSSRSHKRIARYDILLEFAKELYEIRNFEIDIEAFKEILVYELYLRENLKSRPEFAKPNDNIKEMYIKIFQKEDLTFKYLEGYKGYTNKQISRLTHIERFSIDILKTSQTGQTVKCDNYILFDYLNRSLLNHSANTIIINQLLVMD